MIKKLAWITVFSTALLHGCAATSLVAAGGSGFLGGYFVSRDSRSVAQIVNDTNISGRINTAYYADPLINPVMINVDTYNGIVTLGGIVSSPVIAERAVQIAQHTKGVKVVVPELAVKPPT